MEFLKPMVLSVRIREAERNGPVDLYLPADVSRPRPAIVFVHGGPVTAEMRPLPREWPLFQAYGSLAAERDVVGAVIEHGLDAPNRYSAADGDVRAAVEQIRADPRVDADRVVLWFFSGGSLLAADWLREPPSWLRALALTYPLLVPFPGWPDDARFRSSEAVAGAGDLPIVLTRVGREHPFIASGVEAFVTAAEKANLEIIDVPQGRHGFDNLDDTDESRAAITRAVDTVVAALGEPEAGAAGR